MALVICPECNKEISDSVKKCPHCGYKLKKEKKENVGILSKNGMKTWPICLRILFVSLTQLMKMIAI